MRAIGLPFLFATLTAGQTWQGHFTTNGFKNSGTCTGESYYTAAITRVERMSDGCSCVSGTSMPTNDAYNSKQCYSCRSDGSYDVAWTNDCNSGCSSCTGASGISSFASALLLSTSTRAALGPRRWSSSTTRPVPSRSLLTTSSPSMESSPPQKTPLLAPRSPLRGGGRL